MISSNTCSVVGIDHGTTNSCVGVYRNGRVDIAANSEGHRITPSIVAYLEDSEPRVGDGAIKRIDASSTVFDMKRLLGKLFSDDAVKRLNKQFTISSVQQRDGSLIPVVHVKSRGQSLELRPHEICAKILEKMKKTAMNVLNNNSQQPVDVTKAVIAVPAHFTQTQKAETVEAARLAGLEVLELITEPVAAAYAYGYDSGRFASYRIVVFDLGGGTFDVTVIQVTNGEFRVLELGGDMNLGGRDFDELLYNYCRGEILRHYGFDCDGNRRTRRRLLTKCEDAKKNLSAQNSTSIYLGDLSPTMDEQELPITRAKFVELCVPLVQRTIDITADTLRKARLQPKQINEVLLSGGSARIPLVHEKLTLLFPDKAFNRSINEDEVVAYGAAVRAAQLCKQVCGGMPKMSILQKTALSLGVNTEAGTFDPIIPRLSPLTDKLLTKSKIFETTVNDQTVMEFKIYEGERRLSEDNIYLGAIRIDGLRKAIATESKVKVTFTLNMSGLLTVTAEHGCQRVVKSLDYANSTASANDVEEMLTQARENAPRDEKISAAKLAFIELIVVLEKAGYEIPKDVAKRTPTQHAQTRLIKEYRDWADANEDKGTEHQFQAKMAKFNAEIGKYK